MNETEYIITTEQDYLVSEITSDSETPVTTVETSAETSVETSSSADYDFTHIQQNIDGILLMTSGIFFLLVIYLISKFLGNFFSM